MSIILNLMNVLMNLGEENKGDMMINLKNEKLLKAIADADKPFVGVKLDENKLSIFKEICELAEKVGNYKDTFINIISEYPTEFPNDRKNAIAYLNILTPVNINAAPVRDAISKMVALADNVMIAYLESGKNNEHKIARVGFGVRDIWLDKDGLNKKEV